MKRLLIVMISVLVCAGAVMAAYVINDIQMDIPPKPNYSRILSMHLDFSPVLTACVRSEYQLVTNVLVETPTYTTNVSTVVTNESTGVTNEFGEDIVIQVTNEVSEIVVGSTNISHRQVLYSYPLNDRWISPEQTRQLSSLTLGQIGLSTTSTVEQIMDAIMKAGMSAIGIECGGGDLLSE